LKNLPTVHTGLMLYISEIVKQMTQVTEF